MKFVPMTYNTGETSEQLKEKYNPEGSTLRKAQLRMLDMLRYFDSVCKEIGVHYILEGGNALGAVRHGGFIPWDDDVDVDMTRDDVKKLCDYLMLNPHPQYVIQTHKTDSGFWGDWVVLRDLRSEYIQDSALHNVRKFKGLQIDIFPMEKNCFPFLHRVADTLTRYSIRRVAGHSKFLCDILFFLHHKVLYPVFRLIDKLNVNKNYYMYPYGHSGETKFPGEIMFPPKDIFYEGEIFSGPNDINAYLSTFFKNYMDLPPVDSRNKHQATYKIWD